MARRSSEAQCLREFNNRATTRPSYDGHCGVTRRSFTYVLAARETNSWRSCELLRCTENGAAAKASVEHRTFWRRWSAGPGAVAIAGPLVRLRFACREVGLRSNPAAPASRSPYSQRPTYARIHGRGVIRAPRIARTERDATPHSTQLPASHDNGTLGSRRPTGPAIAASVAPAATSDGFESRSRCLPARAHERLVTRRA
jgi:hypothetical protein